MLMNFMKYYDRLTDVNDGNSRNSAVMYAAIESESHTRAIILKTRIQCMRMTTEF
jgi:hypothetical protein